ncbi:MAG: signal recognition particle-docking protein FtsY, partial [Spirochaetota bacterium]|nr:signal recognition particle-docking protein FtsY [Spirochaetota bacterium]
MAFLFKRKSKDDIARGLHRTKESFGQKILSVFSKNTGDEDFFDEIEENLIMSDVGVETTLEIIDHFKNYLKEGQSVGADELKAYFKKSLCDMIPRTPYEFKENSLNILFILGVNGVGKTTSIGKLAHRMKQEDKSVMLAACDTFRAAAIDQLAVWGERAGVPVVKHAMGGDPGAVLHDAIDSAISKKVDVLLVDTAGRLHNKANLMAEIEKLHRLVSKKAPDAYHETILVLDAGTGQNAFVQAESFNSSVKLDGIILTKLDSTAKGGIVIALAHQLGLPVKFAGLGEGIEDLIPFDRDEY